MRKSLLVVALALLPCRAGAELCRRPDGSYTNRCTATDSAVQGGKVSWGEAATAPERRSAAEQSPAAPAPAAPSVDNEKYWRDRLLQARRDLREAERTLVHARQEVGDCKARQRAAMLGMGILDSCEQGQIETAERAAEEARDYLENGLFDECRRSESCQQSWVR